MSSASHHRRIDTVAPAISCRPIAQIPSVGRTLGAVMPQPCSAELRERVDPNSVCCWAPHARDERTQNAWMVAAVQRTAAPVTHLRQTR